jgi:hypothetical protein
MTKSFLLFLFDSGASRRAERTGLPRRFAPRNDEAGATFAMTSGGGLCNAGFLRWTLSSPAWRARGWPKAGRGRRTKRRAAPLIKKGAKERDACPRSTAKKTASLRSAWNEALSRPCGPPSPASGGGKVHRKNPPLQRPPALAITKAAPYHCESLPPRHCEARSAVAIQFLPTGAKRR